MTRGKYADRSQAVNARRDALKEVENLRRENAELRKENDRLATARLETLADYDSAITKLRRQVVERTSPELEAAQEREVRLVADLESARGSEAKIQESHHKLFDRVVQHFIDVHHATGSDGVNIVSQWITGSAGVLVVDDRMAGRTDAAAERIMLARGQITKASLSGRDGS